MSRMNQVMQIGDVQGDIHYYIEDYAYTYLKKQKGKEKTKYFLYGEKEENSKPKKLYIYGIAQKPKMEQSYFKEYYPLGFLKIKEDETFWITLKGQEQKISGFYVFYAPNQAMQEYLVDNREDEKKDKPEEKAKRQMTGEKLPMKETLVSARKIKRQNKEFKNEKFIFPIGGIVVACLILFVLTSSNGQKKMEIFKQVIAETIAGVAAEPVQEDFIIEEKSVNQEKNNTNQAEVREDFKQSEENNLGDAEIKEESNLNHAEIEEESNLNQTEKKEEIEFSQPEENSYEEYIVKNGDTLVAICKSKYGSLLKMEEVCALNNIQNADYIAPGQKIYLP